eukprot:8086-Heterococcus_DN1.PRE.6
MPTALNNWRMTAIAVAPVGVAAATVIALYTALSECVASTTILDDRNTATNIIISNFISALIIITFEWLSLPQYLCISINIAVGSILLAISCDANNLMITTKDESNSSSTFSVSCDADNLMISNRL